MWGSSAELGPLPPPTARSLQSLGCKGVWKGWRVSREAAEKGICWLQPPTAAS